MADKESSQHLIGLAIEKDDRVLRTSKAEFVQKQKSFLRKIQQADNDFNENERPVGRDVQRDADFKISPSKKPKTVEKKKTVRGAYCWICHKDKSNVFCTTCSRKYHHTCIKRKIAISEEKFRCHECKALDSSKKFDVKVLNRLLKYILKRVISSFKSGEKFQNIIPTNDYPKNLPYVMHLNKIIDNVNANKYDSGKSFLLDFAWIVHIYSIYFPLKNKSIDDAKNLLKFCKEQIWNMETCQECFIRIHEKKDHNWFTKVCSSNLHLLVWAKLSGYPYWPAKVMAVHDAVLTVQFFGEHERAFVPAKDCFLFSQKDPNLSKPTSFRHLNYDSCIAEANEYIRNIEQKFGDYIYADYRTPLRMKSGVIDLDENVNSMIRGNYMIAEVATAMKHPSINSMARKAPSATVTTSKMEVAPIPLSAFCQVAKRKHEERVDSYYYRKKHAKILENPGVVVLDRVDLTVDAETESSASLYAPSPNSTDKNTKEDANHDRGSSTTVAAIVLNQQQTNRTNICYSKDAAKSPISPHKSDSAVTHFHRENKIMEMALQLPSLVSSAKEKYHSLENDLDTILNYANQISAYKADVIPTHCINCGQNARLFLTWNTGYCDYPCREEHRQKYGELYNYTQDYAVTTMKGK